MRKIGNNKPNIGQVLIDALLFSRDIDKNGCWNWTGNTIKTGYGHIGIQGKQKLVHRVAYELWVKPIPEELKVCHSCDNRLCFNPSHLFLGTQKDNMIDAARKGKLGKNKGEDNHQSKLTTDEVREIKEQLQSKSSYRTIANKFGVTRGTIAHISQGKTWKNT